MDSPLHEPYRSTPLTNYASRGLNPERWAAVVRHAGSSVLDAGCGNGQYVLKMHQERRRAHGVDRQRFDAWQAAPELFQVADLQQLDADQLRFETVVSFEVLEHVAEPLEVLRSFHRIAQRNIILTVPNCRITPGMRESMLCHWHWIDHTHVNFFDLDKLSALVERAGFRVREASLINRMSLEPLVREQYGDSVAGRVLLRALRRVPQRDYHLTCLLVASRE